MDQNLKFSIKDEEFIFDCRRAIYWPRRKILLAADLHWGKTQYLRQHGIAISDNVFEADLLRLSNLLQDYEVDSFVVLGDLIHHEQSLTKSIIHKVAEFRNKSPCELVLIKGNHDRYAVFPESWGIVEENDLKIEKFIFTHDYQPKYKDFQFAGHVHPMIKLRAGYDSLRLPSFMISERSCLLPAFSHLTGGQDIRIEKGQKAIVVMNDGLELFER